MRTPHRESLVYDGVQRIYVFPNGYGASVIRHRFSNGHEKGLWELAVLGGKPGDDSDDMDLDYTTPITSDVEGWLTDEDVDALLDRIEALPDRTGRSRPRGVRVPELTDEERRAEYERLENEIAEWARKGGDNDAN